MKWINEEDATIVRVLALGGEHTATVPVTTKSVAEHVLSIAKKHWTELTHREHVDMRNIAWRFLLAVPGTGTSVKEVV